MEPHEVLVAKTGTISDVLSHLQKKANIPDEVLANVRAFEVHNGKMSRILSPDHPVSNLNEFLGLFAEKIPEEEKCPASDTAWLQVLLSFVPTKKEGGKRG